MRISYTYNRWSVEERIEVRRNKFFSSIYHASGFGCVVVQSNKALSDAFVRGRR